MSSKQAVLAVAATGAVAAVLVHKWLKSRIPSTLAESIAQLKCEGNPYAPAVPTSGELDSGATVQGAFLRVGPIILQRASFGALWIRIGFLHQPAPDVSLLRKVVKVAIEAQTAPRKAALYVSISEACLSAGGAVDLQVLRDLGFAYHHYRPGKADGEWVYVKDLARMVPAYATSVEGATGVVFSPDQRKVLCVWERGGWNTPGGAVDPGEMKVDGLKREIYEEVGVTIDDTFEPIYLGGYQAARARDDRINDNFSVFAVKASSEHFEVDQKEIHAAMWVPWAALLDEWIDAGRPGDKKNIALSAAMLPADKTCVSKNLLRWLETYRSNKGMRCKVTPGKECKIGV